VIAKSEIEFEWMTKTGINLKHSRQCSYNGMLRSVHANIFVVPKQ